MIDGLRMRKVPRGLPRAMSEEEIERLLMATPDLRYRTSMTLTYACGLRISETVAVTIDDVKSKEGLLHVRSGKGATERMAPLPDGMVDHLKDYWRKTYPKPVSWLFYGRSPEHAIKQDTLRQAFNRARDLAGIASHHTFHGLRHSAATHMFEAGGSIDVIQDALGHRSADTTRNYARATSAMFKDLSHPISKSSLLSR